MGFNFNEISKKKPPLKTIDSLYQYIKNEFDKLIKYNGVKYTFCDLRNFDYNLSYLYDEHNTIDNHAVNLGTFNISMNDIISDNDKYLYTIVAIPHLKRFLEISPTLQSITGDPTLIERNLSITDKINKLVSKSCNTTYYNNSNIEKNEYQEYYDNIMEKTDPFPHLHGYSHCIFFNNLITDQPTDLIYTDSLIIKSLSKVKFYNTTHIIIAGYFDRHSFEEIKHILPFYFSHEIWISDLNIIVIGALVFELPYIRDEKLYEEQLRIQKEWQDTIQNFTKINIKKPTRYYDALDPKYYDLNPASITLYDLKKIYTMNISNI